MAILVLMRHGQPIWNEENRLTGSVDVPLTEQGRVPVMAAALKCAEIAKVKVLDV